MITSYINHTMIESYKKVHPRFEAAFEGLKKLAEGNFVVVKYEIDGNNIYAMVQEYDTKPVAEKKAAPRKKKAPVASGAGKRQK